MSDDDSVRHEVELDPPLRLELAIDHQAPLEGLMSSPAGVTRPFAGWAGLASALTTFLDDWGAERDREHPKPDS